MVIEMYNLSRGFASGTSNLLENIAFYNSIVPPFGGGRTQRRVSGYVYSLGTAVLSQLFLLPHGVHLHLFKHTIRSIKDSDSFIFRYSLLVRVNYNDYCIDKMT